MEYAVQVEVAPAADAPELDALQCHGVDALLAEGLDGVDRLSRPERADVELVGFRMATHSRGALLSVVVEASALASAEDGVRHLIESVVERSEPLAGWRVLRCAVELSQEAFQAGLDAAHAEPAEGKSSDQVVLSAPRFSEERLAQMRASLSAAARGLKAFDLEHFGYRPGEPAHSQASEESATLAAGALMAATSVLIDHVMEDAETLASEDTTAADDPGLMALHGLPPQYALRYDARFARKFAVATISITARLTDENWRGPACVAEQLALRLLVEEAKPFSNCSN
ncbi:hypothetical protein ACFLIM_40525 [Nonomuraea sp. M3C6]|uniref:Uncharacterized protein n=1 Tax=Nonomuraea marmarensis TaxID=3351344 RepID=A0ABW7ATV6_9ACTN